MTIRTFLAAASLALGLSGGAASAATVIDLTGSGGVASSYSFAEDGIGVTATGERRDNCFFIFCGFQAEDLSQATDGLGVTGGLLDSAELDGQVDERITFTFNQAVRLISVSFNAIDGNDPYNVLVDFGSGLVSVATNAMTNPFVFAANTVGSSLRIAVDGNASAFRVTAIEVAAVPLPAGGLLLVGALGGLAVLRRRRRA